MITEESEYESIAKDKARCLAEKVAHPVEHGSEGFCPNCGHIGVYDLLGAGVSSASIFFSIAEEKWRCMICGLDKLDC